MAERKPKAAPKGDPKAGFRPGGNFERRVIDELLEIRHQLGLLRNTLRMFLGSDVEPGTVGGDIPIEEKRQFMADIKTQLSDLSSKVENQGTVIEGARSLLQELRNAVQTAQGQLNAGDEEAASASLQALASAIETNTEKLAKALAANTDADDEVHASGM